MKTWILIVLLFGNAGGSITTQEFDSYDSCIKASLWVVNERSTHISTTCLPKGDVLETQDFDLAGFEKDVDQVLAEFGSW